MVLEWISGDQRTFVAHFEEVFVGNDFEDTDWAAKALRRLVPRSRL